MGPPAGPARRSASGPTMIVVRILGGLGNQMFQYALGRRLALERGEPLLLDTTGFETYTLHDLALDHLSIDVPRATPAQVAHLTKVAPRFPENLIPRSWLPRALRRGRRTGPHHLLESQGFTYDPRVIEAPSPLYLDGYWQSERYFAPIADQIRRDFAVRTPLAGENLRVAEQIDAATAVSLHVRRGDYAADPVTRERHGLCPVSYYEKALAHVVGQVPDARLFVFSDDPDWAAQNLPVPDDAVLVRHNDASTNYEDMRLMSRCRHHIIANSSFSWWGAWLNASPEKIVVAPMRWMADEPAPDVCPPDWVRL